MVNVVSFSDLRGDDDEDEGGGQDGAGNFSAHAYGKRATPKRGSMEGYIYHELQESALCGQHCLNNLLQAHVYSAIGLGEIAQQLDRQETSLGGGLMGGESSNVDAAGNFSIQVLRTALQRSFSIELISWTGEAGRKTVDPTQEEGFIVNRREHWFSIRKINGKWFNLNSTQELPEVISEFHVVASLAQLRNDGFTVFIPRGKLPKAGVLPADVSSHDSKFWVQESVVLNPPSVFRNGGFDASGDTKAAAEPSFKAFSGSGQRLDGSDSKPQRNPAQSGYALGYGMNGTCDVEEDPELAAAIAASLGGTAASAGNGVGGDYDADLARAIAMSVDATVSAAPAGPKKSENEIRREKRLAALTARGL